MQKPSVFITFEGGEGSGKTTQIKYLSQALSEHSIPHVTTREPGGTPLAERIRPLLVESQGAKGSEDWHPLAETMLFFAARAQHWHEKIKPALANGTWVICDRFMDSTLVYQGIAKGLGFEHVKALHDAVLGEMKPDATFLLDIAPEDGLRRAVGRQDQENRFESLNIAFHHRLREGFQQLAKDEPSRFHVIDAGQPIEVMHQRICEKALSFYAS